MDLITASMDLNDESQDAPLLEPSLKWLCELELSLVGGGMGDVLQ